MPGSLDRGGGGRAGVKFAFCQVRWLDVASSWGKAQKAIMSTSVCVCVWFVWFEFEQ